MARLPVRLTDVDEQAFESIERRDSLNHVDGVFDGVVAGPRAGRQDRPAHQEFSAQQEFSEQRLTAMRRRFQAAVATSAATVITRRIRNRRLMAVRRCSENSCCAENS